MNGTLNGAFLDLVKIGYENNDYKIPRNLAINTVINRFENNTLIMNKATNTIIPEYLEIQLAPDINILNFKSICHKICLEMYFDDTKILNIPLRFMWNITPFMIVDKKIYIQIPFELFMDDINLISIDYSVKFNLLHLTNEFEICNMISKAIYYDEYLQRKISTEIKLNIIQILTSTEINYSKNPTDEIKYIIKTDFTNGMYKGIFIEASDINEINNIKLKLNGFDRLEYNKFLIMTKCVKISHKLLYLPFNQDKLYTDRTNTGFEGSINFSIYDNILLELKFDNPIRERICIYCLGSNLLKSISKLFRLYYPCIFDLPINEEVDLTASVESTNIVLLTNMNNSPKRVQYNYPILPFNSQINYLK